MRFIALTAALLVTPFVAFAQDYKLSDEYTVELGKPYPVIDGVKRYIEVTDGIICVKNDGDLWFLQKLNSNSLTQASMHEYQDFPKGMVYEYAGIFGDRLHFFYSVWDKENEKEQLFAREIDMETGKFIGKGTKLLSINGKVHGSLVGSGFYRFHVTDKFEFITSTDDENLVVQYVRKKDKKDLKDKEERKVIEFSVAVFNPDLTMEWTADLRLPYNSDVFSMKDYTIDSNGEICIIASIYKGNEEKVKDREEEDYQYEFLRCTGRGEGWETTVLALSGRKLLSVSFFEDMQGELRATGFYKKTAEQVGADGVYVCAFDDSDELSAAAFHEIPKEIINMYLREKDVKRNEKKEDKGEDLGLTNMETRRVLLDEDGSMFVVGEKRYTTVHCVTDSRGSTRCYTIWHADDLLVCHIDPEGNMEWMRRIPKRMSSSGPIGSSFKYMNGNGAHHFVHFSRSDDLDIRSDEPPTGKGDLLVIADQIAEDSGELTRKAVLNPDEVQGVKLYQLSMERLTRTANGELLMEAYKKQKQDVLVRIVVKE